ncbi:LCP family protein [Candidatus Microgenomates bacterium]|nr:LCP family protein [Candidatus Microgenomates bacterium]
MVNYTHIENPLDTPHKTSSGGSFGLWWAKLRRRFLSHVWLARGTLVVSGILLFLGGFLIFKNLFSDPLDRITYLPRQAIIFLFGKPTSLDNRVGRTNILLMGAGGAGHEAPDLTDTMIFISLDRENKSPVFLSLPRDTWVPSLAAKLNTTYFYGNQKKEAGGLILAKASVSEILDQPVHYAAVLDFGGFISLIDLFGGLEVDVERTFDDFKYPIAGRENDLCDGDKEFACRYEHLHFDKGKQKMDGATALKFVRSRNAVGDEGTDFARSARQQKVLSVIKSKILSPAVIFNPFRAKEVLTTITSSIKTDIPEYKLPIIARMYLSVDQKKVRNLVLDGGGVGDAETGFLINPPISAAYNYQWVLVPRGETWEEVRKWLNDILYRQN